MAGKSFSNIVDSLWKWGERTSKVVPAVLTFVAAAGTGWAARSSAWLNFYGPVAWTFAGLLGGVLFAFLWWGIAAGAEHYSRSQWIRESRRPVDSFNPLDRTFTNKRIEVSLFRGPLPTEVIESRTFVDCELVGPAIVFFTGHSTLQDLGFINCDFIAVENNRPVHNVILFKDITVRGGKLVLLTILIPRSVVSSLPSDVNWLTATKAE